MVDLREGFVKRIHVNTSRIKDKHPLPVCIWVDGEWIEAAGVEILGTSQIVVDLENPFGEFGASVWIETDAEVKILES